MNNLQIEPCIDVVFDSTLWSLIKLVLSLSLCRTKSNYVPLRIWDGLIWLLKEENWKTWHCNYGTHTCHLANLPLIVKSSHTSEIDTHQTVSGFFASSNIFQLSESSWAALYYFSTSRHAGHFLLVPNESELRLKHTCLDGVESHVYLWFTWKIYWSSKNIN